MASSRRDEGRNPFRDMTNIARPDPQEQSQITDPKELKRQRARERYASMLADQKSELLKRRRQTYQDKKVKSPLDKDNHEELALCHGEQGSSPSHMPELDIPPASQGGQGVVLQVSSSTCNKENMPPRSSENLNLDQVHDVAQVQNSMSLSLGRANYALPQSLKVSNNFISTLD